MRSSVFVLLGFAFAGALAPSRAAASELTKFECVDIHTKAQDLQREEKFLAARAALVSCASSSCPQVIAADCVALERELDALIPTVVFEGEDQAGNVVAIDTLTVDGQPTALRHGVEGTELDPGRHSLLVESAGRPPTRQSIVLRSGEKRVRAPIVFGPLAAADGMPVGKSPRARDTEVPSSDAGSTRRVLGLVLGGVGLTAMGLGGAFGLVAKSNYDDARRTECAPAGCSRQGKEDTDEARTLGTVGTVVFSVGAVVLLSGVVMWFMSPPRPQTTAWRVLPSRDADADRAAAVRF
jgi:hypothetical protein